MTQAGQAGPRTSTCPDWSHEESTLRTLEVKSLCYSGHASVAGVWSCWRRKDSFEESRGKNQIRVRSHNSQWPPGPGSESYCVNSQTPPFAYADSIQHLSLMKEGIPLKAGPSGAEL